MYPKARKMEQAYNENTGEVPKPFGTPSLPLHSSEQVPTTSFEQDDELFIRKALENNLRVGVELLYKRYFQPMCTHAVKFVGSREVAEDLVSEIFFQFYSNKTFLEITSSYRLYLFRTVRNRAYNYLRWDLSRKADITEASQKPGLDEQQPDQISQFEELYHDLEEAVNKLPFERRRIYLMQKFEGKKYREIADELHLSVKTVDVQLNRANQYIRNLLRDKWLLSIIGYLLFAY
jgi:RNA polymerase sigma-70 factor (ECF subfamily)